MQIEIAYVSKDKNLAVVAKELAKARIVAIDTETTKLDALTGKIRLIQLATVNQCFVLDIFKLDKNKVRELILEKILPDKQVTKLFHNGKFDLKFIQTNFNYGLREIQSVFDTYIAAKLCMGGEQYTASLENLCSDFLGIELDKTYQKYDYSGNIYKEQVIYAALDAAVLIPLYHLLRTNIIDNKLMKAAKLEFDCIPAVVQLELNGVKIDKKKWLACAEKSRVEFERLELELKDMLGDINLKSSGANGQVCQALSAICGFKVMSKSKDYLQAMIDEYEPKPNLFGDVTDYRPVVQKLLEYSVEKTNQEKYGKNFLSNVHPATGRVHSDYKMADTTTFRFSSSKPNLQNIPRESEKRAAFVPEEGHKLVCYDFSQIELRVLAFFTGDALFMQAFLDNVDCHSLMAAEQYGVELADVTKEQRQDIKPVNFGVPYGQGAPGLAKVLGIEVEDAKRRLVRYYGSHPEIVSWHKEQQKYFKTYDCVRTVTGRLRNLAFWKWKNAEKEFIAIQASKNFPIQSTAADIQKLAMTRMYREFPESWKLVLNVHDEFSAEVEESEAEEASQMMERIMVECAEELLVGVPCSAEGGVFDRWQKG